MALSLPQTISIALAAALSAVVDYRLLVLVMSTTMLACAVPLARAPREQLWATASRSLALFQLVRLRREGAEARLEEVVDAGAGERPRQRPAEAR